MNIISHKTVILTSIVTLATLMSTSSHAKIYKWTDKQGQTHYTATPPRPDQVRSDAEDIEKEVKSKVGKYVAPPPAAEEVVDESIKPEDVKLKGPSPELVKFCDKERDNLEFLQKNFRTRWTDEKGEVTILDQEQRQEKVNKIIANINERCTDIKRSPKPK